MATGGLVVHGGRRIEVGSEGVRIGRDPDNDLVVDDEAISRHHAVVRLDGAALEVEDLGSTNGTIVDGQTLRGDRLRVAAGATVVVGNEVMRCVIGETTSVSDSVPDRGDWVVALDGMPVTVGRDAICDVVLDDPNVSRCHAEVIPHDDGTLEVHDLGSANGTRVGGRFVRRARVESGATLGIGPFRLTFRDGTLTASDDRRDVRLEARAVTVEAGGRRIVEPTSLCVEPGELVAVIGHSGAGKTTLVRALAGVIPMSAGEVLLNGEPVGERQTDVGYLPQDEIVHAELTPREALRYAGRLRLPPDVDAEALDARVEQILADLALSDRADARIKSLSGGERKRAGLAVELLGSPSILFLDEPTTGLDPGLEAQTMELLRNLASGGRSVVVVTHATRSLHLCDAVAVMGPGGRLCFFGAPDRALEHFEVDDLDDVYEAAARMSQAPGSDLASGPAGPPPAPAPARRRSGALAQAMVLTRRYLRVFLRDRRNLVILIGQIPLLGVAIGLIFGDDIFRRTRKGNPNDGAQLLFLLATTAIWIGALASTREVVKERAVIARERAVGVRLSSYLASKAALLFTLVALQSAALVGIVTLLRPLHASAGTYLGVGSLVVATAVVAVSMGLFLSAFARSQDQALSFIPLALIPQLLFAGALVPVSKMGDALQIVSAGAFSRWSFAGLGTVVDLAGRLKADRYDAKYSPFKRSFFDVELVQAHAILLGFMLALLALTVLALRRRT